MQPTQGTVHHHTRTFACAWHDHSRSSSGAVSHVDLFVDGVLRAVDGSGCGDLGP